MMGVRFCPFSVNGAIEFHVFESSTRRYFSIAKFRNLPVTLKLKNCFVWNIASNWDRKGYI